MKKQTFILKNHDTEEENIEIKASLEVNRERVIVEYIVTGELNNYIFENLKVKQQRANELWKATCFELFISPRESLNYWELNISTSKEWNCYAFDNYKENMREEKNISIPNIEITQKKDTYILSCELNFGIGGVSPEHSNFNLAIILLDTDRVRHFYSINKKNGIVDFHNKDFWKKRGYL